MLLPVLASAFVGGIIGYSTNWLAIKMLFRPLTEKYIGRWRVPFTPGLIPKKRDALAKSLGGTVADYLVTTDTLVAAFEHPEFTESLENLINEVWARLANNQQPLAAWLQLAGLEDYVATLPAHLAEKLLPLINDETWLCRLVTELRTTGDDELPLQGLGDCLTSAVTAIFTNEQVQTKFFAQVQQLVTELQTDETTLVADVVPLILQEQIHNLILTDAPGWLDWLHDKLQAPASKALIQSFIQQFLAGNTMLKLVAAFADTSKLADSLIQALTKEEIRTQIISMLLNSWDQLLTQPVAHVAAKINVAELSQQGSRITAWAVQPHLVASIKDMLWQSIKPEAGQFAGDSELTLQLESLARRALELVFQAPSAKRMLTALLHGLLTRLLQATPASLLGNFEPLSPTAVAPRLQAWLLQAIASHGPELLSALRLPEVVEAQVNALDIIQVEDILLQVMREQLSAITNLGFLLGALIGAVMPFINRLLGS